MSNVIDGSDLAQVRSHCKKKGNSLGFVNSQVIQGTCGSVSINSRNEIMLSNTGLFPLHCLYNAISKFDLSNRQLNQFFFLASGF